MTHEDPNLEAGLPPVGEHREVLTMQEAESILERYPSTLTWEQTIVASRKHGNLADFCNQKAEEHPQNREKFLARARVHNEVAVALANRAAELDVVPTEPRED